MRTAMTFEKQILARIEKQHLRPTPRGYFKARDGVFWAISAVLAGALGLAFGMIIFMVHTTDISLIRKLDLNALQKATFSVPFFWIIASLVIAGFAYFNLGKTRKGYRISGKDFLVRAVIVSGALGILLYALGATSYVNNAATAIPIYNVVVPVNATTWFDPDHGLLSGIVKEKDSDLSFTMRDREGELWNIEGSKGLSDIPDFHPGDHIKLIGKRVNADTFHVNEILVWTDSGRGDAGN